MSFRSELEAEPWRFDLLSVLRRLERENPSKPRIGEARRLEDEFVEIAQDPYLEFPTRISPPRRSKRAGACVSKHVSWACSALRAPCR